MVTLYISAIVLFTMMIPDDEPDGLTAEGLATLLAAQKSLLTAVSTGRSPIDSVSDEYAFRRSKIRAELTRFGLADPFPWRTPWDWYGRWSQGDLPSYRSRREFLNSVVEPVLSDLEQRNRGEVADWGEPVESWATIESRLDSLKQELATAFDLDALQDVGRRVREIIIGTASMVFDANSMVADGEEAPKAADAKNRLSLYLDSRVSGSSRADLRRLMKSALEIANTVTHASSATRIDAFAAAQACVFVVRCVQEIERDFEQTTVS